MDHERHQRVMELLESAVELPPEKRASFLAEQCGDDDQLRREVESLLTSYSRSGSFLDAPIAMDEPTAARALVGTTIGRYLVKDILAVGGMGVVYRAEQQQPRREVALKLLRPGLATQRILRRFEHEAEILGRLSHPGIAKIIEAGTFDAGAGAQPYFAMELIDGESLTDFVVLRALDVDERLALMQRVCDAVQHAHLKGVVHRDLKPSNILVDQSGQPRILDFGIARLTDEDTSRMTMATETGQLLGTLAYMSPEQVAGKPDEVDARSDVYALGVLLYEVVAGGVPHEVSRHSIFEAARIIREEPPPRLRTAIPAVRDDVETIILKAMEKEKDRRYQSAGEFGADIARYLNDEPILARGPSRMYQLRTFARRNRAIVAGVAVAIIVLVAGLIGTSYGLARAMEARELAERETERALQAERTAAERADQLAQVAAFQESQLADIDAELMGVRLRESISSHQRMAWEQSGFDADEVAARLSTLDELLAGANFTDIALTSLDENIFQRAVEAIDEQFDDQPLIRARLLETLATAMTSTGMIQRALPLQEAVLDIRREQLGSEDIDTLIAIGNVGTILVRQGKLVEAEPYLLEARMGLRQTVGDDHDETLNADSNLAALRLYQGRLEEAEDLWTRVLNTSREVHGNEHDSTLLAMSNLAEVLRERDRPEHARALLEEVLAIHRRVNGDSHPSTLNVMNNLASLLGRLGEHTQAHSLLEAALRGRQNALGSNHPSTLITMNNLARWHFGQGNYEQAAALWKDAVDGLLRTLGSDHQTTLSVRANHATLLIQLDRFDEAERHLRGILDSQERLLGQNHSETLTTLNSLAFLMQRRGEPIAAVAYQRAAVEGRRRALGDDNIATLTSINNLGSILRDLGQLDEAAALGAEAVERGRATLPPDHINLAVYLAHYGRTLSALQSFAEAKAVLEESHRILATSLGPDHPRTVNTRNAMADLYSAWHETEPTLGYDVLHEQWRNPASVTRP